jgi:hypothetical protein
VPVCEARRVRESVPHLDGQPVVNEHLLHYLVEEVLFLWVRPGGHHLLEVVHEGGHRSPVEGGEFELLATLAQLP